MSTEARLVTLEQAMAELALAAARAAADMERRSAETDARLERLSAESKARLDQTTANIDRLSAEMRGFKDEMRGFKDEVRAFKDEVRADAKELNRQLGEQSNKMGRLAEDIVAPSIPRVFRDLFGLQQPESIVRGTREHRDDPSRQREFDVTAWGGQVFLVSETRSRLRPEDIKPFLESLPEVRAYWREAEDRRIVGAFSSFYVDPTLVKAVERAGLYLFGLGSGLLEVLNTPGFKPREF